MSTLFTSSCMTAQISLNVLWLFSRLPATYMQAAYTALRVRPFRVLASWVCSLEFAIQAHDMTTGGPSVPVSKCVCRKFGHAADQVQHVSCPNHDTILHKLHHVENARFHDVS